MEWRVERGEQKLENGQWRMWTVEYLLHVFFFATYLPSVCSGARGSCQVFRDGFYSKGLHFRHFKV